MKASISVSAATPNKGKGSPDSLPSIATTSVTSSEGESYDRMSPRVLFKHSNNDTTKEVVENIQTMIESKNSMVEKKTNGVAALSISSSASTEVAAWNLSPATPSDPNKKGKPATTRTISNSGVSTVNSSDDEDEETVDGSVGAFPTSEMRKLNKKTTQAAVSKASKASKMVSIPSIAPSKKPSIIMEDPPEDTVTCNRAAMSMTPKQLTEIFNSFDGNKTIWSMREQYSAQDPNDTSKEEASNSPTSMAAETVRSTAARWMDGWMPQNEDLVRELEALKEVLEDNSNKMLNLREAVETQRALNALKEVEIEDKEQELQATRTELEDLAHQKELFIEREQELLETIEELTDRVDDLIEKNCNAENRTESAQSGPVTSAELEPFDEPKARPSFGIDPEPFDEAEDRATCIRRQDSLIAGLRNTLKAKDKEIFLLKEHVEETSTKNAIHDFYMKDSAAALKAKDGEILSLKARLEVALAENAKNDADKIESRDLAVSESDEEKLDSSPSETDEIRDGISSDGSEDTLEETHGEEFSDTASLKSAIDQENAPPSPPPTAPTGLVAALCKKLETEGSESEKPITARAFPIDRIEEVRMPLEQKKPIPTTRGRSPTPVSECSTEEEMAASPNPVPPTPQASPVASEDLLSVIANLSKRIDAVESESRGSSCTDVSRKANCELSIVVVKGQENDDPRRIDFENEECPGTIEVMLEGQSYGGFDAQRQHAGEKAVSDEEDKDSCCCWSVAVTGDLE
ncbi:unnamed protein product [Cylindrotheca closterium]|uniref:Uncharacterized protein n=1 Tax=Cylindrotheca closterium TaxID=2856 RepID=A0AAD2FIH8_9STRA|nr:unnamed protein product [Cylindrotheca closterium]